MNHLVFIASIILLSTLLPTLHSTVLPSDTKLIQQTCKQTPYFDLCISYLQSDSRSQNADVKDLALIMVDFISSKTKDLLKRINELIRKNPDPQVKKTLDSCAVTYNAILIGNIPEATEALQKGNYKFAEQGTNDAANGANYCETDFGGKSPITDKNKVLHDVSTIAASIVRILL